MKKEFKNGLLIFGVFIASLLASIKMRGQDCAPDKYWMVGAGIGSSDKNVVVNMVAGYNTSFLGIEGSVIAHADNRNPVMLNIQLVKSFYDYNKRFSLLAGYSYHITTFDKVGGTKKRIIAGMEWASLIKESNALLYIRGQVSGDNFCLMVGISGIFGKE